MKKEKVILLVISILLMVIPFFINVYSIYRLLSLCLGIILFDIAHIFNKKRNLFLLIYLPIVILIGTYGIDYLVTYTLNYKPIYVFKNKVNKNVAIYNSLFYRVYSCQNEMFLDKNYSNSYPCSDSLIEENSINKLLTEPDESYKKLKNDVIKVTGKISKIVGTNSVILRSYIEDDTNVNGYVKFNETSSLKIVLNGVDVSKYKIYDYITVVGLLSSYNKKDKELTLVDTKVIENNLYDEYEMQVILSDDLKLKEYSDNIYTYGISNIYLDYGVDKYELSYVLKDKKKTLESILTDDYEEIDGNKYYKLEKFNVLLCSNDRYILVNNSAKIDEKWCNLNVNSESEEVE